MDGLVSNLVGQLAVANFIIIRVKYFRTSGGAKTSENGKSTTIVIIAIVIIGLIVGVGYLATRREANPPTSTSQSTSSHSSTTTTTRPISETFEAEATLYPIEDGGVHDGDTIYVRLPLTRMDPDIQEGISDLPWEEYVLVRFARINAPELENPGGPETTEFLRQLITDCDGRVYLDLDDLSVPQFKDQGGERLLGVAYIYINNKPVNIVAEVLRWGEANYSDLDWIWSEADVTASEFDYNEWRAPDYPYVR